ncbi:hypothetical protein COV20_01765 [Candidatus Woesearchaeota archaeon CG10_big_fil_rev_8_21_14_0_10_45_16]|nr:MAG: hypothetical protein COV20_01765 [Candidatus Woesearchaeota archaeon CG10_big_fil_rev_8_21_14_0_10_45_16]
MEISKLRKLYQLKNVERVGPVGKRKESPAEHSWSSLILADYFLSQMEEKKEKKEKIDRLKVYELLIYHDVVEIETGDIPIHHEEERKNKKEQEMVAAHLLKEHLPLSLGSKFHALFEEMENQKTIESRFAKAIDALDAIIHFLDYKEYWKGWDEAMVRKYHGEKMKSFPLLQKTFEEILSYVKKQGYFSP